MEILLIFLLGAFVSNYVARRMREEDQEDKRYGDDSSQ